MVTHTCNGIFTSPLAHYSTPSLFLSFSFDSSALRVFFLFSLFQLDLCFSHSSHCYYQYKIFGLHKYFTISFFHGKYFFCCFLIHIHLNLHLGRQWETKPGYKLSYLFGPSLRLLHILNHFLLLQISLSVFGAYNAQLTIPVFRINSILFVSMSINTHPFVVAVVVV